MLKHLMFVKFFQWQGFSFSSTGLAVLLAKSNHQRLSIRKLWDEISNSLRLAAKEVIGWRKDRKNSCNFKYCRVAVERKQVAYLATLRSATMQSDEIDTEN